MNINLNWQNICIPLGIAVLVLLFPAQIAAQKKASGFVYVDKNGNGKKDRGETGVPHVRVSNGREVTESDSKGMYTLPVGNDNILFVIKPSGFAVPIDSTMLPRYYYIHKPGGSPAAMKYPGVTPTGPLPQEVNFVLKPQQESKQFRVLLFGDPQVYSQQDIDWFHKGILEEVKGVKGVSFGMSLGDLVGDNLHLFKDYIREMAALGIPWYNMVGNHDLNWDNGVDSLSDESYEARFGPANYAFEYGNAHFIVLDDILAPDPRKNDGYWGGLRADQLDFVKNDLAHTDTARLVVIAYHIPMKGRGFRDTDRVKLFEHLRNHRHVLMLSGHTHKQNQIFYTREEGWSGKGNVHEYNVGTTSGDWYSGELDANHVPYATMRDGTEKGYAFLNLNGNTYSIDYKVAGKASSYQMNIFGPQVIGHRRDTRVDFFVNFFMGAETSRVEYRVGDNAWKTMKHVDEIDPAYYQKVVHWDLTEELMPGRRPSDAEVSTHLWRGSVSTELPVGIHTLYVRATDMFDRVFIAERSIHVEEPKPLPKVPRD
jgi:hypothetical protein